MRCSLALSFAGYHKAAMRALKVLFFSLVVGACQVEKHAANGGRSESRDPRCGSSGPDGECALFHVSVIDLIARPREYHRQNVQLAGWVNLEFEGNAVYLSRADWEHAIYRNGLWLDLPDSLRFVRDFKPRYMLVEGRFVADRTGHFGMWSGSITDIKRLEDWVYSGAPPR
jgi:hypothetical protein